MVGFECVLYIHARMHARLCVCVCARIFTVYSQPVGKRRWIGDWMIGVVAAAPPPPYIFSSEDQFTILHYSSLFCFFFLSSSFSSLYDVCYVSLTDADHYGVPTLTPKSKRNQSQPWLMQSGCLSSKRVWKRDTTEWMVNEALSYSSRSPLYDKGWSTLPTPRSTDCHVKQTALRWVYLP